MRGSRTSREGKPDDPAKKIHPNFQVIGDIAIFSLPPALYQHRIKYAEEICSCHRNIRTVLHRSTIPRGEFRVAAMEVLIGDRTMTECREFGFRYHLDVTKTFYTPKLASERHRVSMQVLPGEKVLVPFAGVGPCVIPPAARGATVTAIEKNPVSAGYLRENVTLNNVTSHVEVFEADLWDIAGSIGKGYDRAIIPAPYGHDQAVSLILPLVRSGGIIHFYTFKHQSQIPDLIGEFRHAGLEVEEVRRCGSVAPGIARFVLDMKKW